MLRKGFLEAKGESCQGVFYPDAFVVRSILAKRCMHTWEDTEINQICTQNQAKKDDWPKKTWKTCTIKVIQPTIRA